MKWEKIEEGSRIPIKSWCETVEDSAYKQAVNLSKHPVLVGHVALMPDAHVGYGMPIGGVIAAKNAVIPTAVGVDIGCGMIAVETDIPAEVFSDMALRRSFQNLLKERIPVGEGAHFSEKQEWCGFESYIEKYGEERGWCSRTDRCNLGTLGGGNHFIELQKTTSLDGSPKEDSKIWLMIHSGSRNLGKRIEEYYHKEAVKFCREKGIKLPDADLAFLPIEELMGQEYVRDMEFALEYAKESRCRMMEVMKQTVLEFVPEAHFIQTIDIHHNYAAKEEHFGEKVFVHRKGATSAKLGELGVIPGSMGTASYIVRGLGKPESFMSCSHGAGRVMSRASASTMLTVEECDKAMDGIVHERWTKFQGYQKKKRCHYDLSEAPQAYKDIEDVISSETDLVEPLVRLVPLAVLKG